MRAVGAMKQSPVAVHACDSLAAGATGAVELLARRTPFIQIPVGQAGAARRGVSSPMAFRRATISGVA